MNRHTLCHALLCAIHTITALVLLFESAIPHAICAFAAAVIYATLTHDHHNPPPPDPSPPGAIR